MIIVLKSGETYKFNLIKKIVDKGSMIEIKGNYKPRGRYFTIELYKKSIENLDVISSLIEKNKKPYYCSRCDRRHVRGKIYNDHLKYKQEKFEVPDDRVYDINGSKLFGTAKRQVINLVKKWAKEEDKKWRKNYIKEINKILIEEGLVDGDS